MKNKQTKILSFEEFRNERVKMLSHIAEKHFGWDLGQFGEFVYFYPGELHLEYDPHRTTDNYCTVIGRCDFYSSNIIHVEKYLYAFYLEEHCLASDVEPEYVKQVWRQHLKEFNIPESWYW